jgi:hypothetical protein
MALPFWKLRLAQKKISDVTSTIQEQSQQALAQLKTEKF